MEGYNRKIKERRELKMIISMILAALFSKLSSEQSGKNNFWSWCLFGFKIKAAFMILAFLFNPKVYAQDVVSGADGIKADITDKSRVISIGSAVTEIIYALDADKNLVAVDQTSLYPEEAEALPKVPYTRNLTAEGVLSLNPTLIVASQSAGPEIVVEQIRSTGTPFLKLPSNETVEGAMQRIERLGVIFERQKKAEELIADIQRKLHLAEQIKRSIGHPKKVLFIYARGPNNLSVAGKNTSAETIINLAGGVNAFQSFEGYKPLNAEALVAANPDVILMMKSGLSSLGGVEGLLKAPGVSMTGAAENERIYTMDGNYLLGFGPRLGDAVLDLMDKLYPEKVTADKNTSSESHK